MSGWHYMGLAGSILSAIGCGTARADGPTVGDFSASVQTKRSLALDPDIAKNGRYGTAPGEKTVLVLHAERGKSRIAKDQRSDWSIAVELPGDLAAGIDVSLDGLPAVARIAGEDVVYLARGAKGHVTLKASGKRAKGTIDIAFDKSDRDFIKLGALKLSGALDAALE